MAKFYTLDKELLVGTPEIRIGDKVFPVDDRKNTVTKILKVSQDPGLDDSEKEKQIFKLAFGKAAGEVAKLTDELSWKAYQSFLELIISAVTGQDPEGDKSENKSSGSR